MLKSNTSQKKKMFSMLYTIWGLIFISPYNVDFIKKRVNFFFKFKHQFDLSMFCC